MVWSNHNHFECGKVKKKRRLAVQGGFFAKTTTKNQNLFGAPCTHIRTPFVPKSVVSGGENALTYKT